MFECYSKAAELGEAFGQYNLGLCYAKGESVPVDLKKAQYWMCLAVDQGCEEAISDLKEVEEKLEQWK